MNSFGIRFVAFILLLTLCTLALSSPALFKHQNSVTEALAPLNERFVFVLDAGHGGEDGGAVSAEGSYEKDLNLSVTLLLRDIMEANGMRVLLTRDTDTLLYDRNVNFEGRKKALDLAARRAIAEKTENCVFVSIHMNAFPQTQYSGLQVWYSKNEPASLTLAQSVQSLTQELLQPHNNRRIKPATSSIYLLHHLSVPAILVECGFLSNPDEARLLSREEYQKKLAFLLFLALSDGIEKISSEMRAGS